MPAVIMADDPWMAHMLRGEFEAAWRISDALVQSGIHQPVWNGQSFSGRHVLIRCVHGLGDTIQFIRYAALLKDAGAAKVSAQMHPPLVSLLSTVCGLDRVFSWVDSTEYDTDIEVMELPWAFRTAVETIPRQIPYLFVPNCRTRCSGKIGLVWSSSTWDESRSIPLKLFKDFADFPLISLQHGPDHLHAKDFDWVEYGGEQTSDLLQTAIELKSLKLLITPDTMLAHLAGALGVRTWVLLKHHADWRWISGRNDSPWYPTMRLFRQSEPENWGAVLKQVHEALVADYS